MIHKKTSLNFECTQCGACCCGDENHFIAVSSFDLENICKHIEISMAWLRRRYVSSLEQNRYTIRIGDNGRCVFLRNDNSCRIYPVRPVQCRTYPWWPEILHSKSSWNAEAVRCEGINAGKKIPVSRIMASLRQQLKFEKEIK